VLGTVTGDVYGLAGDETRLYYVSWAIYGSRGDLGQIRKDGQGATRLTSLDLEPRGLALDGTTAFYTSGIRLMAIPKAGGDEKTLVPIFSSQHIALHGTDVFGVPADYGPYDRLAKVAKTGGEPKELGMGKRPTRDGTKGWSRVAVDDSGAYVTDSGNDRVLAFSLDGGKPKIVTHAEQPYDLAIVGAVLVFDLAKKGELMAVAKSGGSAKKLAEGLVKEAHFAADDKAAYVPVAGKTEDDPVVLSRVPMTEGNAAEIARVPGGQTVSAVSLDADCVYWTQRESSTKTVVYAAPR